MELGALRAGGKSPFPLERPVRTVPDGVEALVLVVIVYLDLLFWALCMDKIKFTQ